MKKQILQFCLCLIGWLQVNAQSENRVTGFQLENKDTKKVVLAWEVQQAFNADYFSIEKSSVGKPFETISIIKANEGILKYQFADEYPSKGISYYRIKYNGTNGATLYSDSLSFSIPGSSFFTFYPNPADNFIIIRSDAPSELLITDGLGKQRISRNIPTGPTIIDISGLEKGVYLLRISDKVSGRQQLEKLLKK